MKKQYAKLIAVFLLGFASLLNAQSRYSIGLVSSSLVNIDNESKLSNIKNPLGYGVVLGTKITKDATIAATLEYMTGDVENSLATETNYRAHLSLFVTPINFGNLYPYFSGGAVVSNIKTTLNGNNNYDTNVFARFGAGVDYKVFENFGINFDLGIYSNGLKFTGISNSIGFRYIW